MSLKFFTNPRGLYPFHIIPFPTWLKGYNRSFKELIIDCGVNNIKGKKEYVYINHYPLKYLSENTFWVIPDYPFNFSPNLTQKECIIKSKKNILKWSHFPNSISTVQFKFQDFDSFKKEYNWVYLHSNNIIGIGNCVKANDRTFLRSIINHIIKNNPEKKRIHIFGLNKYGIKYLNSKALDFDISIDSMKWDFGLGIRRKGKNQNTTKYRNKIMLNYFNQFINSKKQLKLSDFNEKF